MLDSTTIETEVEMKRFLLVVPLVAALLAGCSDDGDEATSDDPTTEAPDLTVTATDESLAALVVEHVGEEPFAARPSDDPAFGKASVGGEVQFLDPQTVDEPTESDGVEITAIATAEPPPWLNEDACDGTTADGCGTTLQEDGSLLIYEWVEAKPGGDPGHIWVAVKRADESVAVLQTGPAVSGDPQDMDLEVSVDAMNAIANDPRLSLMTTQELVDTEVPNWQGD